jgi:hypothetical protein
MLSDSLSDPAFSMVSKLKLEAEAESDMMSPSTMSKSWDRAFLHVLG